MKKISIVIPTYNEIDNITLLVSELTGILEKELDRKSVV